MTRKMLSVLLAAVILSLALTASVSAGMPIAVGSCKTSYYYDYYLHRVVTVTRCMITSNVCVQRTDVDPNWRPCR